MTRSTLSLSLLVALSVVGCATSGDVGVVRSVLVDSGDSMDLIETHRDGSIEVELTVERGGEEPITELYEWPDTEAPPTELVAALAALDPALLDNAREVEPPAAAFRSSCARDVGFPDNDPACLELPGQAEGEVSQPQGMGPAEAGAASIEGPGPRYVWPSLVEEAAQIRLEVAASFRVSQTDECSETDGFSDCVRAAR